MTIRKIIAPIMHIATTELSQMSSGFFLKLYSETRDLYKFNSLIY